MLRFLPLIALAAAVPALAQDGQVKAPTGDGTADKPIVITAGRLDDLRKALQACLERKCPPDQDIDASLAIAETQFVNGDYRGASGTIGKSLARNRKFAKDYPVAVSDLLRANSRVAAHLGDRNTFRYSAFDTVSALKAGLPDTDPRVYAAKIEVGDMYVHLGRVEEAIDKYREVERGAVGPGLAAVRGMARLRIVGLYSQLALIAPSQYLSFARKTGADLIGSTDPEMAPFGQAARVLMARLDARRGNSSAIDRLMADYPKARGKVPVLVFAPPVKFAAQPPEPVINVGAARIARENYDGEWVDIGFWVAPDGRVTDADVYRVGRGADAPAPYWTKPILAAIRGRRYAPLDMDPSQPGVLRVERYTQTAWTTARTGSHIVAREPRTQIEMLDLSVDPPAVPSGK